jgi:hypothetical protein
MVKARSMPVAQIAARYQVSRTTIYNVTQRARMAALPA